MASLTAQQSALLAQQKEFDLQNATFQTDQQIEAGKAKETETLHDALLAVIAGMSGR